MNIQLQYGTAVATVPAAALAVLDRATQDDLKVLLTLCAKPALTTGNSFGECVGNIAAEVGCPPARVEASLSFWRGAGVLNMRDEESVTPPKGTEVKLTASPESHRKLRAADALPHYNSAELADLLESRKEAAEYLKECQEIWGRMFNIHDHNIILGLTDYLGLEWDYVLTLLAFCVKEQDKRGIKRSIRYVETRAFTFYDEGVADLPSLQEKLRKLEQMEEVEGQLRRMFGMGERALTPTEKKKFSSWLYEYRYGMDIITRAFEVTVDAKGSPNLKYMDAVLSNWNRDGLRTVEDIQAAEEKFQADKAGKKGKKAKDTSQPVEGYESTFNAEDLFAAAVKRSLGDDFDISKMDNES